MSSEKISWQDCIDLQYEIIEIIKQKMIEEPEIFWQEQLAVAIDHQREFLLFKTREEVSGDK